jgi:hypothetical protein
MDKATRDEVYFAVDSERDYQEALWNSATTSSEGKHSVEEWLMYISDYVQEAQHILSRRSRQEADPKALDNMRKIAAMAVACMEQNGCSPREAPDANRIMQEHGISLDYL